MMQLSCLDCHQSLLCGAERSLYYATLVESAAKFKLLTALLFRAQATASFKTVNEFFMCLTAEFQISVIVSYVLLSVYRL